jgi:hypothetical protein
MNPANFPKQIVPLAIIFVAVIAGLIVARTLFVPESFGEYGHYRANAVGEITQQPIVYAGASACYDCHDDIVETKADSYHRGVTCEVCHGPAAEHIEAPDEFTPDAPRGRGYCPLCHGYDPSRPSGFPQIIAQRHNPGKPCMSCHDPHNPLLPHAPEECSACHRSISNLKTVSHHAALACTQCHDVQDEHLSSPKFVRAEKPDNVETCATCHSRGADSGYDAPTVDFDEHGGRYLCWDCHYPHHPEAHL